MTRIILSTGNVMSAGPSVLRSRFNEKSNFELVTSLRSNIESAQESALEIFAEKHHTNGNGNGNGHVNGTTPTAASLNLSDWTTSVDSKLYIPIIEGPSGLEEERRQYEITVKLFLLARIPSEAVATQVQEAVTFVLEELKVSDIDLVIVSFADISFEGDCGGVPAAPKPDLNIPLIKSAWEALEKCYQDGKIKKLGLAEFDRSSLEKFLPLVTVKPAVDQINVKDCCDETETRALRDFSKGQGITLYTHSDCSNILPEGTLRELLGSSGEGFGVLANPGDSTSAGLKGDVQPRFVVKYTAIVHDRGVIENKGYFAVADLVN